MKSVTKIATEPSPGVQEACSRFSTALRFTADRMRAPDDSPQPILDSEATTYKRLTMSDGSAYWVISITGDGAGDWLSLVAADPETGLWFAAAVRRDTVIRFEEFPESLIERMPPEQQPFGFAARTTTQP